MKKLHRDSLFSWSSFDEERDVDFHSVAWARPGQGCVVVDPLPLSAHDVEHLRKLGGVDWIVVTNSDHTRAAADVKARFGAQLAAPAAEHDVIEAKLGGPAKPGGAVASVDRWLSDGDVVVDGMNVIALDGSKTPGELALVVEDRTLITGDLVRAFRAGALAMLPDAKLKNRAAACDSVRRLAALPLVDAVLVGDGWPVFSNGRSQLIALAASFG